MKIWRILALTFLLVPAFTTGYGQTGTGIDPEALIERILQVDMRQRGELKDVMYDAEYIEGEQKESGFEEKVRIVKRIYIKYFPDTAWYHEEFLEYYKDGKLQDEKELKKEQQKRLENKRKREMRDISYPMLKPFYPEQRDLYEITYEGVAPETVEGFVCHKFTVSAKEKSDTLINGDFYFEAESFHPVRIDFEPSKLAGNVMFRLNDLNMSLSYAPIPDDMWLPRQFSIEGKGKVGFLFGVSFGGTEYYRHPIINGGIPDEIFEADQNE
jgi:hypothetical protein